MSDPRNVAHAKKVKQEKEHHEAGPGAKPKKNRNKANTADQNHAAGNTPAAAKAEPVAGDLEKSETVLSKLKEMEFHSRANIETLAGLTLTIEDELNKRNSPGRSAIFTQRRIILKPR